MKWLCSKCTMFTIVLISFAMHDSRSGFSDDKSNGNLGLRVLSQGFKSPMEMAIAEDGSVFIANRFGNLDYYDDKTGKTHEVLKLKVDHVGVKGKKSDTESGLMGVAVDPDFKSNNWIYVYYSSPGGMSPTHNHHLSRFTWNPSTKSVDKKREKILLKINAHRENRIHEAGSIAFDGDGNLYLSTGDNQKRQEYLYSCKTSANSNSLLGKILRIKPTPDGAYTIPKGNLFKPGTPNTRPEIFIMGLRNPFRITVDPKTNWLLWGENGPPDHFSGTLKLNKNLLPKGYDEFNLTKTAGFYGYPLIIGDQEPFVDLDHKTRKPKKHFNPEKPINHHPENTGIKELPSAQKPLIWYSGESNLFPVLGRGGESAIAGPIFHYENKSEGLPSKYDHSAFLADWARGWVINAQLTEDGRLSDLSPFLPRVKYGKPINLKLGPKGRLHILYYGSGGVRDAKAEGTLVRVENIKTLEDLGKGLMTFASAIETKKLTDGLPKHPGVKLMSQSDCLSCHLAQTHSLGPTFQAVADKYQNNDQTLLQLVNKVKMGGSGVWGTMYMPPHPQHSDEQIKSMIHAIFELKAGKRTRSRKNKKN